MYVPGMCALPFSANLNNAYDTEEINHATYGQAMADWYFARDKLPHVNMVNATTPNLHCQ